MKLDTGRMELVPLLSVEYTLVVTEEMQSTKVLIRV